MGALAYAPWIGAATVVAGCAQIAGISNTTAQGPATLEIQRASVGATVTMTPLDLSLDPPTFLVPDPTATCGMALAIASPAAPATWSVQADGTPASLYTAPDGTIYELAFASRAQRDVFWAYEHPNPTPPGASSQLAMNVMLPSPYAAMQTFSLEAIGPWASHPLATAELPIIGGAAIATTIAYSAFTKSAPGQSARITKQDVVLLLRHTGADLTGVWQADSFDQTDATDTLGGPAAMTAVTDDHTFDATISPTAIASRYAALRPAVGTPTLSWAVYAGAGYSVGTFPGVTLNSGPVAMTDTTVASGFPMPFAALGWRPALLYIASASRPFTLAGAPTSLNAFAYTFADPASGMTLDLPAGMPDLISLAGAPLNVDGMTVVIDPTKGVAVDIVPDAAVNTLYQIQIDELVSDGVTVKRKPVANVRGPDKNFVLPPWYFLVNHTYKITASCIVGGYPNAATGDLATFALPMSVGQLDSAVFTVVSQ
jgi:hypothetical protein